MFLRLYEDGRSFSRIFFYIFAKSTSNKPTMYRHFFKRLIDLLLSLVTLVLFSPLLIPVCICLLLTGEHYIFYFQKRVGYKNKLFDIWKFATMLKNSPNMAGGLHTLRKDPRLMPLGGFLRKTKINELPQIINILLGDMSVLIVNTPQ